MNICTLQDESTASRCLSLIERHAAKLARMAGGHLPKEYANMQHPLTRAGRARIVELGATAPTISAIATATGWSGATVRKVLRQAGIPTPFFRATGIKKGAPAKRVGPRHSRILAQ
jgi:hypothetical protein